jgi:hypothetical protein
VQAGVVAEHGAGRRFVEHLGFTEEGLMPKFGPRGETFAKYVLFPGGKD